jgi:uncharacterized membrane protein YhhN
MAGPLTLARILFLLGAAIALSHLANDWIDLAPPGGLAWKAGGIVLLGLSALARKAWLPAAGLLLSAVGDVLLELDGWFVGGMAAFGLAHLCYAAAFADRIRRDGSNLDTLPMLALIVLASLTLGWWLTSGMGALLAPALGYQLVITVMVITAMYSKAPGSAKFGAVVFMLSDSLIALGKFGHVGVPTGSVWLTYAAAQILLAWGLPRTRP